MTARHLWVMALGVVALSWAAPLIRLAEPAPALTIAALRLVLAAPPMALLAAAGARGRARRDHVRGGRRDAALLALSAVALAAHFAFWVASVQRTTVLASVVLVTMQPLFVAAGASVFLRERPTRGVLAGIALGVLGAALLIGEDAGDRGTLIGDAFALAGGLLSSVYLVAGRGLRQRMSTASYGAVVYALAAVLLLAAVVATDAPLRGQPREAYLAILALAIVPQLIGHNAMNWALGAVPAAIVAVAILGEPVGATAIAAVLLDEVPTLREAAGGVVVLAGVYVALRYGLERPARADPLREPIEV